MSFNDLGAVFVAKMGHPDLILIYLRHFCWLVFEKNQAVNIGIYNEDKTYKSHSHLKSYPNIFTWFKLPPFGPEECMLDTGLSDNWDCLKAYLP